MITNNDAVKKLAEENHPNTGLIIRGRCETDLSGVTLEDKSALLFNFSEVETKKVEMQAEYDAQTYARNRQTEYPSIEACVHAILDNDNNELDTLQAKRAEIKLKYPKGG